MAFVFDATPKSPTANSYLSVEDADVFASGKIQGEQWFSLSEAQKQALLVQATTRLDAETYGGLPTTTTNNVNSVYQALQWPRNWVVDRNYQNPDVYLSQATYTYINPDIVPLQLAQATFEMAMFYLDEYLDNPSVSRQDMDRLTSMTVGPLTYGIQKRLEGRLPDGVRRLLMAIGTNGWQGNNSNMKLVR